MHYYESLTGFFWTVLGAIGGTVKVLVQLLSMKELPPRKTIYWLVLANMFVSGFSGFIGAVIASTMSTDDNVHVIAAGVSGYLGVAALDIFSDIFKKRIQTP